MVTDITSTLNIFYEPWRMTIDRYFVLYESHSVLVFVLISLILSASYELWIDIEVNVYLNMTEHSVVFALFKQQEVLVFQCRTISREKKMTIDPNRYEKTLDQTKWSVKKDDYKEKKRTATAVYKKKI
jgi:hypothetical protein